MLESYFKGHRSTYNLHLFSQKLSCVYMACVSSRGYVHMCMHMLLYLESGHQHMVPSIIVLHSFLRHCLQLNMESTDSVRLAKKPQGSASTFPALSLDIHVAIPSFLRWFWGSKLRSPSLYSKHFTYWTIFWSLSYFRSCLDHLQ